MHLERDRRTLRVNEAISIYNAWRGGQLSTHDRLTQRDKGLKHWNAQCLKWLKDSKAQKLISRTYGTSCYALSNKTPAPLSEVWQSGRNRNIVRFTESNLAYCIAWGIVSPQSDSPTKLHDSRVTVTVTGHGSKPNQNSSTTALQHLSLNTS